MSKGNFTISWIDVALDKNPESLRKTYGGAEYTITLIGDDRTGHVNPITKKDALALKKKLDAFKKEIRADMAKAVKRQQYEMKRAGL